jgi:hypothetical protein
MHGVRQLPKCCRNELVYQLLRIAAAAGPSADYASHFIRRMGKPAMYFQCGIIATKEPEDLKLQAVHLLFAMIGDLDDFMDRLAFDTLLTNLIRATPDGPVLEALRTAASARDFPLPFMPAA